LITIANFGIVWQSMRVVTTRALDGVNPSLIDKIEQAVTHVPALARALQVKARWLGHRLYADVTIAVHEEMTVVAANGVAKWCGAARRRRLDASASALRPRVGGRCSGDRRYVRWRNDAPHRNS